MRPGRLCVGWGPLCECRGLSGENCIQSESSHWELCMQGLSLGGEGPVSVEGHLEGLYLALVIHRQRQRQARV